VDDSPIRIERASTILYCDRWKECVDFYRSTMGFAVAFENDWFVEFSVASTSMLSVADARRATIESASGAGITLAWQVDSVAGVRDRLVRLGIEVTPLATRWGSTVCYLQDPEGNRIELWTPAT
jgi:catechol-2,3-dioxygenase